MLIPFVLLAAALSFPQAATPPPAPATAPATSLPAQPAASAPVEDPAITALALKIYAQMRAGKIDDSLITPQMQAGLSPEKLAQARPTFDGLGNPVKLVLEKRDMVATATRYEYLATFPAAQLHIRIIVMPDGKVGGYFIAP